MTAVRIPSVTGGSVSLDVSPLSGTVVYRQTFVRNAGRLWEPSRASLRRSNGFSALYTSLDIDVSLAERVKRAGAVRIDIIVGVARVSIQKVVTLDPDNRARSDFRREVERYMCVLHGMPAGI